MVVWGATEFCRWWIYVVVGVLSEVCLLFNVYSWYDGVEIVVNGIEKIYRVGGGGGEVVKKFISIILSLCR